MNTGPWSTATSDNVLLDQALADMKLASEWSGEPKVSGLLRMRLKEIREDRRLARARFLPPVVVHALLSLGLLACGFLIGWSW